GRPSDLSLLPHKLRRYHDARGICKDAAVPGIDNDQTRRISGGETPLGRCSPEIVTIAKANLRQHFSFVGITERFDESLVLLKMTLGWPQTPPHIPMLINFKRPQKGNISKICEQLIQSRNAFDMQLYEFAVAHFEQRVALAGQRFQD